MDNEIYISIDIEADGPIPGEYSMLSLGAAAFDLSAENPRKPIAKFEINLEPLPGAKQDSDTMRFWARNPEAWAYVTKDQVPAKLAMKHFSDWVRRFRKPVLIGYPVTFDFMFVYWCWVKHLGPKPPFGFQGLDLKTLAMDRLGITYKAAAKKRFPKHWFNGAPKHTHKALDDAVGQGVLFVNLIGEGVLLREKNK